MKARRVQLMLLLKISVLKTNTERYRMDTVLLIYTCGHRLIYGIGDVNSERKFRLHGMAIECMFDGYNKFPP